MLWNMGSCRNRQAIPCHPAAKTYFSAMFRAVYVILLRKMPKIIRKKFIYCLTPPTQLLKLPV